jgi:hypothetical protein
MWETLAFIFWTCFVAYATWYLTLAKYTAPISVEEARLLWKIHRQSINCNAKKWREIKHHGKIVGFQCGCGYKHVQQKPLVARPPALQTDAKTEVASKLSNPQKSRL